MKILYTAEVRCEGDGRSGRVVSNDGLLDLGLTPPKELGGTAEPTGTNPEQLFSAGYGACFHSALRTAARRERQSVEGTRIDVRTGVGPRGDGSYGLAVAMDIVLPEITDQEVAASLVRAADAVCPYSNAIRGNVEVTFTVNGRPVAIHGGAG